MGICRCFGTPKKFQITKTSLAPNNHIFTLIEGKKKKIENGIGVTEISRLVCPKTYNKIYILYA